MRLLIAHQHMTTGIGNRLLYLANLLNCLNRDGGAGIFYWNNNITISRNFGDLFKLKIDPPFRIIDFAYGPWIYTKLLQRHPGYILQTEQGLGPHMEPELEKCVYPRITKYEDFKDGVLHIFGYFWITKNEVYNDGGLIPIIGPSDQIQAKIDQLSSWLGTDLIGVHLRGTDMYDDQFLPNGGYKKVYDFFDTWPESQRFYLSTDDTRIADIIFYRYGKRRFVFKNDDRPRWDDNKVFDDVANIFYLARLKKFFGMEYSSYSRVIRMFRADTSTSII